MHVSLNHRLVFEGAVVIGGDGSRAVVDAFTDRGIAQVGQVIGLGPFGQRGIFHLYKVANVHLIAQAGTGPQAGEGANQCASAHRHAGFSAIDVGERVNHRVGCNPGVGNHAIRADFDAFPQ